MGEIGVTFVAVSVDTVDETRNVKVEDALPFMLLSDVDLKATIAFGVLDKLRKREPRYIPVPATFIVDEVGFIRYMQAVNHPHEDFRPSVEELRRIIEALSR